MAIYSYSSVINYIKNMVDKNKSLEDLATRIQKELVETNLYDDVKYNIKSKSQWKVIADAFEALAYICMAVSAIIAFAAGYFDMKVLSFISGGVGVLAFVVGRFSIYAMKESKERTDQVNTLLTKIGIDKIPDITVEPAPGARMSLEPVSGSRMSLEPVTRMSLQPGAKITIDADEIIDNNNSGNKDINIANTIEEV